MPRRPRLHIADYPHHIVQRGHNRAACFFAEDHIELVRASGLKGSIERTFPRPCPAALQRRLQERYPGKSSFSNNGLLFVLHKADSLCF